MVVAMGTTETDQKQDEEMGPSTVICPQPSVLILEARGPSPLTPHQLPLR